MQLANVLLQKAQAALAKLLQWHNMSWSSIGKAVPVEGAEDLNFSAPALRLQLPVYHIAFPRARYLLFTFVFTFTFTHIYIHFMSTFTSVTIPAFSFTSISTFSLDSRCFHIRTYFHFHMLTFIFAFVLPFYSNLCLHFLYANADIIFVKKKLRDRNFGPQKFTQKKLQLQKNENALKWPLIAYLWKWLPTEKCVAEIWRGRARIPNGLNSERYFSKN